MKPAKYKTILPDGRVKFHYELHRKGSDAWLRRRRRRQNDWYIQKKIEDALSLSDLSWRDDDKQKKQKIKS